MTILPYLASLLVAVVPAFGQNTPRAPQIPPPPAAVAVLAGPIDGLVTAGSRPVLVASGLRFTEGPAADADGNVYFVDVPSSRVLRLKSTELKAVDAAKEAVAKSYDEFVVNTQNCFGLMFAPDGRLLACQGGSKPGGRLVAIDVGTKTITALAAEIELDGAKQSFGTLNDLAIDATGGVYFTDPSLSRTPSKTRGILYCSKEGKVTRVDSTIAAPNGVRLSSDGKHVFALSYVDPGVYRFDVKAAGELGEPTKIGQLVDKDGATPKGRGDGLAIDARGNIWCTNPDSQEIQVFSAEGKLLGRIEFPAKPSNCCFGGPDGKTLFVTAGDGVYGLKTEVAGYWIARKQ